MVGGGFFLSGVGLVLGLSALGLLLALAGDGVVWARVANRSDLCGIEIRAGRLVGKKIE